MLGHLLHKSARVLISAVTSRQPTCNSHKGPTCEQVATDNDDGCNVVSCDPNMNNDIKTLTSYFIPSLSTCVVQIAENIILKAGGCKIDDFILIVMVMFVIDNTDKDILNGMTFLRTNPNPTDKCVTEKKTIISSDEVYLYDAQISQLDCISSKKKVDFYNAVAINKNGSSMTGRLSLFPDIRREPVYDQNTCRALYRYFVTGDKEIIAPDACGDNLIWGQNNTLMLVMDSVIELENFVNYARSFAINKCAPRCLPHPSAATDPYRIEYPPVYVAKDFNNGHDIDYPVCPLDFQQIQGANDSHKTYYALKHLLDMRLQMGNGDVNRRKLEEVSSSHRGTDTELCVHPNIDDTFDIFDCSMGSMYCVYDPPTGAGILAPQSKRVDKLPSMGCHCFVLDEEYEFIIVDTITYRINQNLYLKKTFSDNNLWVNKYLRTNIKSMEITKHYPNLHEDSFNAIHTFCLLGSAPIRTTRQFIMENIPDSKISILSTLPDLAIDLPTQTEHDNLAARRLFGTHRADANSDKYCQPRLRPRCTPSALVTDDLSTVYIKIEDGLINYKSILDNLSSIMSSPSHKDIFRKKYHKKIVIKRKWSVTRALRADGSAQPLDDINIGFTTVTYTEKAGEPVSKVSAAAPDTMDIITELLPMYHNVRDVELKVNVVETIRYVYAADLKPLIAKNAFKISNRAKASGHEKAIALWLKNNDIDKDNVLAIDVTCNMENTPDPMILRFVGEIKPPNAIQNILDRGVHFINDPNCDKSIGWINKNNKGVIGDVRDLISNKITWSGSGDIATFGDKEVVSVTVGPLTARNARDYYVRLPDVGYSLSTPLVVAPYAPKQFDVSIKGEWLRCSWKGKLGGWKQPFELALNPPATTEVYSGITRPNTQGGGGGISDGVWLRIAQLIQNGYHLHKDHMYYGTRLSYYPEADTDADKLKVENVYDISTYISVYKNNPQGGGKPLCIPYLEPQIKTPDWENYTLRDGYSAVVISGLFGSITSLVARDMAVKLSGRQPQGGGGGYSSERYIEIMENLNTDTTMIDWSEKNSGYNFQIPVYDGCPKDLEIDDGLYKGIILKKNNSNLLEFMEKTDNTGRTPKDTGWHNYITTDDTADVATIALLMTGVVDIRLGAVVWWRPGPVRRGGRCLSYY